MIEVLPLSKLDPNTEIFNSLIAQGCTFVLGRPNPNKENRYIPATPAGISPTNPGTHAIRSQKDLPQTFDKATNKYVTTLPPILMAINGSQSDDIIALDIEHNDPFELLENIEFFKALGVDPYSTFSVITAGAGLHIYLRLKEGTSRSFKRATAMRPGMDWLGEGGTASSALCAGYEVISDEPIAEAPDALYEWYVNTQKASKPSGASPSAADMSYRALIVKDIPYGERQSYLFNVAVKWAYTMPLNDPDTFNMLHELLLSMGAKMNPPYETDEELTEVHSIAERALKYALESQQNVALPLPASGGTAFKPTDDQPISIADISRYDAARFKDLPINERGLAQRLQQVWPEEDHRIIFLKETNSFWFKQRVWQEMPEEYVKIQNILLELAEADLQAGQNQDVNRKLQHRLGTHSFMTTLLESFKRYLSSKFDSYAGEARDWIGFNNGTLNIKTREFLSACPPGVSATSRVNYDYQDPNEEHPPLSAWPYFLKTMFPNDIEMQEFIPVLLGYCLLGTNVDKKFFLFIGVHDAGKSTFMRLLQKLFGEVMYAGVDSKVFASRQQISEATKGSNLIPAKEARIVVASEVGINDFLNEEDIKVMTGGDEVLARYAYSKESCVYTPQFVPFMTGNEDPPFFSAASGALQIRLTKVPLKVSVTAKMRAQRPNLEQELAQELPYIFNEVLEGMQKYLHSGQDINTMLPQTVKIATREFFNDADVFREFFAEELDVFVPDKNHTAQSNEAKRKLHRVPTHNLKAAFLAYQEHFMQGERQHRLTMTSLGRRLKEGGITRFQSNGVYYWEGVQIKPPVKSQNKMVLMPNTLGMTAGPIMVTFGEDVPPHLRGHDNNAVITKTRMTPPATVVPIK